jgi:hypothetical protein
MKRFFTGCAALVVGILLVEAVHAEPRRSGQRAGPRSRQSSAQKQKAPQARLRQLPRRAPRPWLRRLPSQWLPPQSPAPAVYDPEAGDSDTDSGGLDPNSGRYQQEGDSSGGNGARPVVAPERGNRQRPPQLNSRSPRAPGSQSRRR